MNQTYTANFKISTGVKQGDPLSATLFIIVTDDIIKQLELRGNTPTRLNTYFQYIKEFRHAPKILVGDSP